MPEFISLFSGLGGLDLGLEAVGWKSLFSTDLDPRAVESLKANQSYRLPKGGRFLEATQIDRADIRDLSGRDLLARVGKGRGDVTLLAGGPPCQSWSSAGHQLGFGDSRGQLISEYLRMADELDCRFLLFENVRGLVTARGEDGVPGSALRWLRHQLFKLGWQTRVELLNAADFGVPQRRVRVIIIGYRAGDEPHIPDPSHSKDGLRGRPWKSMRTCLEQLAPLVSDDVIRPSGKLAAELEMIAPGSGVKSPGKKESTRPGGHWGYKQGAFVADLCLPARTVTANAQQDWVRDPIHGLRKLTPRECAALQTFPQEWVITGSKTDQYRLVGNAVPPRLAAIVGKALLDSCSSKSAAVNSTNLVPLPDKLQAAIDYTLREERRNGASRRSAPIKRRSRSAA